MTAMRLEERPVHLGPGAAVIPQPPFTGGEWYEAYGARHDGDGAEGRLVTVHTFTTPWESWEMHPHGDELVLCLDGVMTLHQQQADGSVVTLRIAAGEYAINPPGVWHTADIDGHARALFITAGLGTEHRPR